MRAVAFLILVGLAVPSSPTTLVAAPQIDYLVVPGQRVGQWDLGRPLDTYQLGSPRASWKWRDPPTGIPIAHGYNYLAGPSGPSVNVHTCKDHPRVIQILIHRWTTLPPHIESEALKFRRSMGSESGAMRPMSCGCTVVPQ